VEFASYNPVKKGHGGQIRKALNLLLAAKRPYIYTGGGVILGNASTELRELVDLLGFPCTNTLMGLGAYPPSDPKFLGMLGMHGTYEANMTMQNCDVLLAVGARFDDRVIGNPKHFASVERKIIHVDIDPSSISKRVRVDIPIVGDVKDVLQELIAQVRATQARPEPAALESWWGQVAELAPARLPEVRAEHDVIKPQHVVETLWRMTKDSETYITSDVGQHQMWAAQYYRFDEPRRWINSGGLGTMGVGTAVRHGHQARQAGCGRVLHHRRGLDPDVHPGALDLPAVQDAGQDHLAEQPLPGHGAAVAADRLRRRYSHSYMDALPTSSSSPRPTAMSASRSRSRRTSSPHYGKPSASRTGQCSSTSAPTRPRTSGRWCRRAKASARCCSAPRTCDAR
jgi:hypothetical protein